MTTNFREQLDDALIRNGRVDMQILFSYLCEEQMVGMFKAFYPNCSDQTAGQFAGSLQSALGARRISAAALQHYFVTHRRSGMKQVIDQVSEVARQHDEREGRERDEAHAALTSVGSRL